MKNLSSQAQYYSRVLDQDTVITSVHSEYISEEKVLDEIQAIREKMMQWETPGKISFLKKKSRNELRDLLNTTLILIQKDHVVGTIYIQPIRTDTLASIGGLACQKKGYGKQLFSSALQRTWDLGYPKAISITASDKVKNIFKEYGTSSTDQEFKPYCDDAKKRYKTDKHRVELFIFTQNHI